MDDFSADLQFDLETLFNTNPSLTLEQLIEHFTQKAGKKLLPWGSKESKRLLCDVIDEAAIAIHQRDRCDLVIPLLRWAFGRQGEVRLINKYTKTPNYFVLLEKNISFFGDPAHHDFTTAVQALFFESLIDDPIGACSWKHHGGSGRWECSDPRRALHFAIESGNEAFFNHCLDIGANVYGRPEPSKKSKTSREGPEHPFPRLSITPLELAVLENRISMIKKLLKKGHSPDAHWEGAPKHPGAGPVALEMGNWPAARLIKKAGGWLQSPLNPSKRGDFIHPEPAPRSNGDAKLWMTAMVEQYLNQEYLQTKPDTTRLADGFFKIFKVRTPLNPTEQNTAWIAHHWEISHQGLREGNLSKLRGAIEALESNPDSLSWLQGKWAQNTTHPWAFWATACCLASFDGEPGTDDTAPVRPKRLACLKYLVQKAQGASPLNSFISSGFSIESHQADGLNLLHWAVLFESPETLKVLQESGITPTTSLFDIPSPGVMALQEHSWKIADQALTPEIIRSYSAGASVALEVAMDQGAPDDLRDIILERMDPEKVDEVLPILLQKYRGDPLMKPQAAWLEKQILLLSSVSSIDIRIRSRNRL